MTGFDAFYFEEKFYINGTKEYTLGSILEKYLQKNFKDAESKLTACKDYLRLLHYPETRKQKPDCELIFPEAIAFFDRCDEYIHTLPPYNTFPLRDSGLYDIFNQHSVLFDHDDSVINSFPYLADGRSSHLIELTVSPDKELHIFLAFYKLTNDLFKPFLRFEGTVYLSVTEKADCKSIHILTYIRNKCKLSFTIIIPIYNRYVKINCNNEYVKFRLYIL